MLKITGWDLKVCGILVAGVEVGDVGHVLGFVQTSAWVLGEDREQAGSFAVVLMGSHSGRPWRHSPEVVSLSEGPSHVPPWEREKV